MGIFILHLGVHTNMGLLLNASPAPCQRDYTLRACVACFKDHGEGIVEQITRVYELKYMKKLLHHHHRPVPLFLVSQLLSGFSEGQAKASPCLMVRT